MKILLVLLCCLSLTTVFAQTHSPSQTGTYFKSTPGKYFKNTIEPWRYQYTPRQIANADDSSKKLGQIIFWRSEHLYDNESKKYWKPGIIYDVYYQSDSNFVADLADKISTLSSCVSINKGGDILFVGHFMLLSPMACVNCASASNVDYCRNIIKRILGSVEDKNTYDWNGILQQFIIARGKLKPQSTPTL